MRLAKSWIPVDDVLEDLYKQIMEINGKMQQARNCIHNLKTRFVDMNGSYYDHLRQMSRARQLASQKDVQALEQLSHTQMEEFMSQWNKSESLRKSYKRRISHSLENRGFGRDGRVRIWHEEPRNTDMYM